MTYLVTPFIFPTACNNTVIEFDNIYYKGHVVNRVDMHALYVMCY